MTCGVCLKTNLKRAPHKRKEHDYEPREAIYTDIIVPIIVKDIGNTEYGGAGGTPNLYFISFMDMATRYAYARPIANRAKAVKVIDSFLTNLTTKKGKPSIWLMSDNAGEYTSEVVT